MRTRPEGSKVRSRMKTRMEKGDLQDLDNLVLLHTLLYDFLGFLLSFLSRGDQVDAEKASHFYESLERWLERISEMWETFDTLEGSEAYKVLGQLGILGDRLEQLLLMERVSSLSDISAEFLASILGAMYKVESLVLRPRHPIM